MILADFQVIRPPFETDQTTALDWFVDAHTESEKKKGNTELAAFREAIREKFWRVGCKPDAIGKRGHILADYLHRDWEKMDVYRLTESLDGFDLSVRNQHYEKHVGSVFETYYPENGFPPEDLIHVSCTGYISPSEAQKIASKRNWGDRTA